MDLQQAQEASRAGFWDWIYSLPHNRAKRHHLVCPPSQTSSDTDDRAKRRRRAAEGIKTFIG